MSIYKKTEENYQLKLKASRALLTEVSIFPPFFVLNNRIIFRHYDVKLRARGVDKVRKVTPAIVRRFAATSHGLPVFLLAYDISYGVVQ